MFCLEICAQAKELFNLQTTNIFNFSGIWLQGKSDERQIQICRHFSPLHLTTLAEKKAVGHRHLDNDINTYTSTARLTIWANVFFLIGDCKSVKKLKRENY